MWLATKIDKDDRNKFNAKKLVISGREYNIIKNSRFYLAPLQELQQCWAAFPSIPGAWNEDAASSRGRWRWSVAPLSVACVGATLVTTANVL